MTATLDYPAETDHGIICGGCSDHWTVRRHATVADIRRCCAIRDELEAECRANVAEQWRRFREITSVAPR